MTGQGGDARLLLLHVCCAPCAAGCIERLLTANREVRLYYSNSNIATEEEFLHRLEAVRQLAELFGVPLEIDPYDHAFWRRAVAGFETEPERGERCLRCFRFSLSRTAARAAELGANFATTLTVSPHKSSRAIFETASEWNSFEPWDFKKQDGFKRSRELTREYDFYLQNFCGCEFSLRP